MKRSGHWYDDAVRRMFFWITQTEVDLSTPFQTGKTVRVDLSGYRERKVLTVAASELVGIRVTPGLFVQQYRRRHL